MKFNNGDEKVFKRMIHLRQYLHSFLIMNHKRVKFIEGYDSRKE